MLPVEIIATGALSVLGSGTRAVSVGSVGARPVCQARHHAGLAAAGALRPTAAAVDRPLPEGDRAEMLLAAAWADLTCQLNERLPGWRAQRVGVVVGTSAGAMPSMLRAFAAFAGGEPLPSQLARSANYFAPLRAFADLQARRRLQVLAACASSTIALGIGCRWLEDGEVELVIAGGYDALTEFVAAGFDALGATSGTSPAPFRVARDGMLLGEGAGLAALRIAGGAGGSRLLGFGMSSDAVHVTAPDRTGDGLRRAAQRALEDAAVERESIDLISAHATATPFNDAAESRALTSLFGAHAPKLVVHPFKAVIGHTLGAAGVLETLAAVDALDRGIVPAAVGDGPLEPELSCRVLECNEAQSAQRCLKLSAAFGGANAALVIGRSGAGKRGGRHAVELVAVGSPQRVPARSAVGALEAGRVARLDTLSGLVLAAVGELAAEVELAAERTGIVLGSAASTLDVNERFERRRRERGARSVEPRLFPATSPNVAAGYASIALALRGPTLAVASGPDAAVEALRLACELVAWGDAEAMLAVASEATGAVTAAIWSAAGWPLPEPGAVAVLVRRATPTSPRPRLHPGRLAQMQHLGELAPGFPRLLRAVEAAVVSTSLPA
jgi:3-oxoacyl-[acyl-carrier-protein] synthase-1/3-oxoacyl-[acyl-carrier-protein] synthase II